MSDSPKHRPAMFGPLMFIGLLASQRALAHGNIRAIDYVLLFAGGACFGIGITELVRFFQMRCTPHA